MEADSLLLRLPPILPDKYETQNSAESNASSRIMDKLGDAIFRDIAAKYSHIAADQLKCRIQRGLQDNFPSLHTPTHPTYAMMIQRAIGELGENEGSSEEAISDFIKREYEDLPLAHSTFLQRYLGKLCESGELVSSNGRYKISVGDGKVLKRKRKRKRGRGRRGVKTKGHRAGVECPEEGDGSGGDNQGRRRRAGGVNEANVGDGDTELGAEEKEMVTKEKNKERLFGDRTGSELDQQSHGDKQLLIQNNDNSPQSSLLRQGGKSKGRGRPRKTNQAAVPGLETLSDQNLQSRETGDATLQRPRREIRPPKCYELIQ